MRRSAAWVVGICAVVALGGVATAAPKSVTTLRVQAAGAQEKAGTTEQVTRSLSYVSASHTLTLSYPGASYVKVHFSRLALLPGDWLTVTDLEGGQSIDYRFGLRDEWAMSVDGDTAVLTLHGQGVQRAARNAAITAMRDGSPTESVCGGDDSADAVCYRSSDPVAYNNSRAVARLLINGDELCSAWRVGPGNRMLTNHHCFTSTVDARNTEVWFNYECAICGGFAVRRPVKVFADKVLATDPTLDYTLFTVQDFAAVQAFGFLTIDDRAPVAGEELYVPQHPGGDPTILAISSDQDRGGNCRVDDPAADGYAVGTDVSYYCDTAGGSSGSPVLSRRTNKVIALHHFGGCPNAGVRIDLIYREIGSLL
ncbi:MAG: trypsin-like peptidase domain-containing protein [Actinobacteria bacterium]|nr:MAG: trypsin-like peptidase domain-containing protein [Actinomycetota bacterium]